MIHLILSLDYEIFGNGSGDVRRDMVEPTRRLLTLCARHGAKLSIMCEVGEYRAMKQAEEKGALCLGYSPSGEIEQQLKNAVTSGHDVQLHLHPWWIGAEFEDGRWRLNPEYRRISDLPSGLGSEDDPFSLVGALSQGKLTLESMIKPEHPEYECLVYRAAMFWGQPSKELISGMKQVGLVGDSSVVRGLFETNPVPTDYRRAASEMGYWWTGADDISQAGPKGEQIIEFPVCSRMKPYLYNFKWTKLNVTFKRRRVERDNTGGHGMMEARKSADSRVTILKKLTSLQPLKYDFCKLSADDMIRGLQQLVRNNRTAGNGVGTPVVMLGHSKDFWNDRNLDRFLSFVEKECDRTVCFSTFGELSKRILAAEGPAVVPSVQTPSESLVLASIE
ncbi:MAG: polysaccharide deacetylase family protein [Planctomycetota bacterium]|jgi:hypothetical protein